VRAVRAHLIVCVLAAAGPHVPRPCSRVTAAPLPTGGATAATAGDADLAWPAEFEGRPLTELPLTGRDRRFADDFPGRIGHFTDGTRELIIRVTTRATRRLHPASDCLKAIGFTIDPLPARRGPDGTTWGCFAARRRAERLVVCEQIRDQRGATWPDPSSWYWPALTGASSGPWWSVSVIERTR